jgi:hypothetical protein
MAWLCQSINRDRSANILTGTFASLTSPVAQQRGIEAVPTHRDVCALSADTDTAASSGDGKWPNYDGLASHRGFAAERSGRGPRLDPAACQSENRRNRLVATGHFI